MMVEKRTVSQEDYFKLNWLAGGALSPDGKRVLYCKMYSESNKEDEIVDKTALFMLDIESGSSFQFTKEETGASNPVWSPDGKKIAFISVKNNIPQIFLMPVDGGEALQLTDMKQGVGGGPLWSPDGKTIAFTASSEMSEQPDYSKPYRVKRKVYRLDGAGLVAPIIQDVYMISVENGEVKQLTNDQFNYSPLEWSPDGTQLLSLKMFDPESYSMDSELVIIDSNAQIHDVLSGWGEFIYAGWLPGDEQFYFIGNKKGLPIGSKHDLYIMKNSEAEPECRTDDFLYGLGGFIQADCPAIGGSSPYVSSDGRYLYADVHIGGTRQIYRFSLDGQPHWEPVLEGNRSINVVGMTDEIILFESSSLFEPSDLYYFDMLKKAEIRLTQINKDVMTEWLLPSLENLKFKGSDGEEVEGWLLKPAVGEAPYPTVLYIHGGPHVSWGHAFSFDFQMLAGAGFAVLFINHRASTGYGDKFSTAIKGDWGNLDYHDLMAGVDFAIEKGLVDADRMGCCGLSGGGNLSCWIVGQTNRFKAAVPENPVTNWVSFYGVSDSGVDFAVKEMGGHPHEIPEVYRKCSPVTYAHNCTTPTLLVQGEEDFRCPAEQSEQFYTILRANGCIAEMVRLPNSPHSASSVGHPNVRKYQNEVLLDWMNRFVLGISES